MKLENLKKNRPIVCNLKVLITLILKLVTEVSHIVSTTVFVTTLIFESV